ncbi:MAG: ATP-binding protein [Bacteroidetes bacterium]|nr:ATP-binding protein [Bacteroidota bacterium]
MLVDFIENSEDEKERNEILSKFKPVLSSLNESFNELVESLQVRNDHEIKSENIIVNDMLQKILAGMETEISTFGAKIEIDLNNSPTVHFPVKYMNSILFNLINNSLKYRSPLRNPIIKIKTEKINNKTILSISDNGIGIDLKMHKKNLFKIRKVFHEHPDAKGFGLFMTKTQVEAMGGKIWAESTPGIGTTFYIEFLKT